MSNYLRQSTAAQVRTIGPFLDDTDFKTAEDGLTIANTDVKIKKNGAASGSKNSGGATADTTNGLYHLTWDATDTGTVGELFYSVKVAGALPVFGSYTVVEEAVYDQFYAASAPGAATTTAVATLQTSVDDIPTNAELATSQAAADDATLAAIAALNNLSAAQVNAEVLDVMNVDTFAEPGQATPGATTTLQLKLAYLYKAWRNKTTQTATQYSLYNDDTTTLAQKATFSDDATTATRGEVATGP